MTEIQIGKARKLVFPILDTSGDEVVGLGTNFNVTISKDWGALIAGSGTKQEIGSGIYGYELTASETDTIGPLLLEIVGAGTDIQRLLYDVVGYPPANPAGPNILTVTEAATRLRCEEDDPNMLLLVPVIDAEIFRATGRRWEEDSVVCQESKNAAYDLLQCLHEGGWPSEGLHQHYLGCLAQLEAMAQYYFTFEGLISSGYIGISPISKGDSVVNLVGKVGATGDQSAKFESVITVDGSLFQSSSDDLSKKWFTAFIVPPEEI